MGDEQLKHAENDTIFSGRIWIATILTSIFIFILCFLSLIYFKTTTSNQLDYVQNTSTAGYLLESMERQAKQDLNELKKLENGLYQIPIEEAMKIIVDKYNK